MKMKKLQKWLDNLDLRTKIFLITWICLILSDCIITSALTIYISNKIFESKIDSLRTLNYEVSANLRQRKKNIQSELFSSITMFKIPDAMQTVIYESKSSELRELSYHLNQIVSESTPFDFAFVETNNKEYASTAEKLSDNSEEMLNDVMGMLDTYRNQVFNHSYVWISDSNNRLYILHSVRNINNLNHLGYLLVRLKPGAVRILSESSKDTGVICYTEDRQCIYIEGVDEGAESEIRDTLIKHGEIDQYPAWNGNHYYTIKTSLMESWYMVSATPLNIIDSLQIRSVLFGLITGLLLLILDTALVKFLTRKISAEMEALSTAIRRMASGVKNVQVPVYTNDDIGKIAGQFNEMTLRNQELVTEIVKTEQEKSRVEMEAMDYRYRFLHTQINPHFIYNSLEMINAIAKINHTPEVSHIVQLIGKYFRTITVYSELQFISLQKEFESLQYFIEIYKVLKGPNLHVNIECPDNLADALIPTMILQPILENSFIYGTRGADEISNVSVTAARAEEKLIINITDNGAGMEYDALSPEKTRKKVYRGIGLPNIHERLRLLYGKDASMQIFSSKDNGTTVRIVIPYKTGNEIENESSV